MRPNPGAASTLFECGHGLAGVSVGPFFTTSARSADLPNNVHVRIAY